MSKLLTLYCTSCNQEFTREEHIHTAKTKAGALPFCSKHCNGVYHTTVSKKTSQNKDTETIEQIQKLSLQHFSSYEISKRLGISRNTVMKYWIKPKEYA